MEPILLVHGYSTDASSEPNRDSVVGMYGTLPKWLRKEYGRGNVFELNVSRYISLEDGIGIDDIARAFDNALKTDFKHLYDRTFHVIIHSTGALVMRTWIQKFSGSHQPIRNLIYLAGANLGSGWAHIGRGQLSRWYRHFNSGDEPGVRVLNALELGSSETIDMQLSIISEGDPISQYGVREYVIIGTQAKTSAFLIPIKYAKEDGSDGTIRVSASNLNYNYVRYVANKQGREVDARQVIADMRTETLPSHADYYHVDQNASSIAGVDRAVVPLAIPWGTAHSGGDVGVVAGSRNRKYIEPLLRTALGVRTRTQWESSVADFDAVTRQAYKLAGEPSRDITGFWKGRWHRKGQYEAHSQIIIRLRDQDGRPVDHYDIDFGRGPDAQNPTSISDLLQDKHRNGVSPNIITFYLRTGRWDGKTPYDEEGNYLTRLTEIDQALLSITATEPQTSDIQYVPFRKELNTKSLISFIRPHETTIVDIEMQRIPSGNVFAMFKH